MKEKPLQRPLKHLSRFTQRGVSDGMAQKFNLSRRSWGRDEFAFFE